MTQEDNLPRLNHVYDNAFLMPVFTVFEEQALNQDRWKFDMKHALS